MSTEPSRSSEQPRAADAARAPTVAIVLYEGVTALDAIGPYEVLSRLPGARVEFVGAERGPVTTDNGMLGLLAARTLEELPSPDVVLVPGGPGDVAARAGGRVLEWLRAADRTSRWTTSVCTGSLILAAAGLLAGRRATSHWLALEELRRLGTVPVEERVVFDGKLVTAAGVSAGIDMALELAARLAGELVAQAIQLGIEYDPQPPFDAGSPHKAPAEVVELLRSLSPRAQGPAAGVRAGVA
ncbi:MAG TPA: DJ-1/PfpI family protein [Solirubrobacteraceae bacterium]|jgi:putative intracellular protease/amidase|nr:DJ-1/PfpI family protein [Solirubrobacteraceae bacterium]